MEGSQREEAMPMKGRAVIFAAGAIVAALVAGSVLAAGERQGRYTMTPTEKGVVRLDTETGVMSLCANSNGSWACEVMPDGQESFRKERDRLEAENRQLKDEIKRMQDVFGLSDEKKTEGTLPDAGTAGEPPVTFSMPSEQDVDKLFDYIEGMAKKIRDRLQRLEGDADKGTSL
jgi:hypothetical protein